MVFLTSHCDEEFENNYSSYRSNKILEERFIENCIQVYKEDPSIVEGICDLLVALAQKHDSSVSLIKKFTLETNTALSIFKRLLKSSRDYAVYYSIGNIADNTCSDFLLKQYNAGKIDDEFIFLYRNYLNRENHDYFYKKLLSLYGDKFKYNESIDYNLISASRILGDLEVLKSLSKFLSDTKEIFEEFNAEYLSYKDIGEWKRNIDINKDAFRNNIVPRMLQDFAHKIGKVTYKDIEKRFDIEEKWEWFVVLRLIELINNKVEIDNWHKKFIIDWCNTEIEKCDFKNAVSNNQGGGVTYKQKEFAVQFFWQKLNFPVSQEVMLDMLSFDWSGLYDQTDKDSNLSDLVISRLQNIELAKDRILNNMRNGISVKGVLESHIRQCKKLNIYKATEEIFNSITRDGINNFTKVRVVDVYVQLGGSICDFKNIISTLDPNLDYVWHIIELLDNQDADFAIKLIQDKVETIKSNDKFNAMKYLLNYGDKKGFHLLISHFFEVKADLPHMLDNKISLIKYTPEILNDLFKVLLLSYSPLFNKQSQFDKCSSSVLSLLVNFGLYSEGNFIKVKEAFQSFIIQNQSSEPMVKDLYYTINRLENSYYLQKGDVLSINNVLGEMKSLV
ncbi:MAG: hypothetical protein JWO03_1436 [Bacteroidetes bacterium]|nr:hypothetical protein [Bacteroidota bacterium]